MNHFLNIPAFTNLTQHLKRFSERDVLKGIWGVIELSYSDIEPSEQTNRSVEEWKHFTINETENLIESAVLEINQLIRMASPIYLEELFAIVTDARNEVTSTLDRSKIEESINSYNKNPDKKILWTWVPDNEDDENYVEGWGGENVCTVTDEDIILKTEYIDAYMELIIDLYVLPDFYSLTNKVFRLFQISQKADLIFGSNSFEGNIRLQDKFNDVIEELVLRKFLSKDGNELKWQGIGKNNLGSAAALARYLEKTNIMGYFGSMSNTREVYRAKFNIKQKEPKEWNKIYKIASKDGLEFYEDKGKVHDASHYWDQLGFIFDI